MNKQPLETHNKQEVSRPSLLRELWAGTCIRYTVLSLILLLVGAIVSETPSATYVDPLRFFLMLPFAFLLTVAAGIRLTDKLTTAVKCILHPILSLGGFYLFGYLPFQVSTKPSGAQVLILLLLAALVYGLIMAAVCMISGARRRKLTEETPYVSQYRKK